PGHLLLGEADFLAAEISERKILDFVRLAMGGPGGIERVDFLNHSSHLSLSLINAAFALLRQTTLALSLACLARAERFVHHPTRHQQADEQRDRLKNRAMCGPSAGGSLRDHGAACRQS